MTVDGGSLIVVGEDSDGLAAWSSSDGSSWSRHAVPDPTDGWSTLPGGWGMGPIVRLGDTLFSFGNWRGGGDSIRPLGWRSADGVSWEYIESSSPFFESGGLANMVASDGALLAVSTRGLVAPNDTAWRWTGETSWTETELASRPEQPLVIGDVAWNSGAWVAFGARYDPANADRWYESLEPTLWRSDDGLSWEPVALPRGMGTGCTVSAHTASGGFVLIGDGPQGFTAWRSDDGSAWSEVAPMGGSAGDNCWDGLTAISGGFLALRNSVDTLTLSVSDDASNWSHSEVPGLSASDTLVAVLGERVLVFAHPTIADGPTVVLAGTTN